MRVEKRTIRSSFFLVAFAMMGVLAPAQPQQGAATYAGAGFLSGRQEPLKGARFTPLRNGLPRRHSDILVGVVEGCHECLKKARRPDGLGGQHAQEGEPAQDIDVFQAPGRSSPFGVSRNPILGIRNQAVLRHLPAFGAGRKFWERAVALPQFDGMIGNGEY
jgi:hypothetical protein